MRTLAWNLIWLVGLVACSNLSQLDLMDQQRSDYDAYLSRHLRTQKLFYKLREMGAAKLLKVTPELSALQAKTIPGFELPTPEAKTFFVVSIEMPDWARFSISDFHFYWGATASKSVKEIMDSHLIQSLYPFAYPHDRAFIVEFEKVETTSELFKIQTSQGQFLFESVVD